MRSLEDYIVNYEDDHICDFMIEDPINEGIIRDGLRKLWNWITGKNKKKKHKDWWNYVGGFDRSSYISNFQGSNVFTTKDKKGNEIEIHNYAEYEDIEKKLDKTTIKKISNSKINNDDLFYITVEKEDEENPLAILVAVNTEENPYNNYLDDYIHILATEFDKNKEDYFSKILNYIVMCCEQDNVTFNGFSISTEEFESSSIYGKFGFDQLKDDKDKTICYYVKLKDMTKKK